MVVMWTTTIVSAKETAAPDFPPGVFSDGGSYSVDDFAGKVLVMIFYESDCPSCRRSVPEYDQLAADFAGRPLYVMAVAAEDTALEAASYKRSTRMNVPMFVDNAGLLSRAYGHNISLRNIRQITVIRPDGTPMDVGPRVANARPRIEQALADAAFRFDRTQMPAEVAQLTPPAELGRWEAVLPQLIRLADSRDEAVAAAATQMIDAARADAEALLEQAKADEQNERSGHAYVAFEELAGRYEAFDELAAAGQDGLRRLRRDEGVKLELQARREYARYTSMLAKARPEERDAALAAAEQLATRFAGTPTANRIAAWTRTVD